ncbi:MAG: glycosyltransferase family 39 protein [Actinomycetota bacterium]
MSRSVGRAAVLLVIVAGVVLRFATASPLWLDEALSVHIATGDLSLADALRRDGHPALFYLLLGWWIDVFGDGDTAVRALSGVLSLSTLPVLWMAARRHGRDVATATLLLALSSPYLVRYATETRMYALLVLVIALGWWALEAAWEQPTARRLLAVAAATAAAMHTHYWSFYAVAAAGLIVLAASRRPYGRIKATRVLGAMAAGALTFVVWLEVFLDQLAETGTPWANRARPTEIFIETLQGIGGNNRFEGESLGVLLAFVAVIGLLAVGPAKDRTLQLRSTVHESVQVPAAAAAIGLGLGSLAAVATGGAFEARYAAIAIPFVLLLAARGIAMLDTRARVATLAVLVLLGMAISIDEARRTRSQGEQVADAIDAVVGPDDIIVFCPDQLGPATTHYLDTDVERRAFPSGDGYTVDWRNYLDRAERTDAVAFAVDAHESAGSGAVWFVGSPGYRGTDFPCGVVNAALEERRTQQHVVGLQELFEGMFAIRYGPR